MEEKSNYTVEKGKKRKRKTSRLKRKENTEIRVNLSKHMKPNKRDKRSGEIL